MTNYWWMHWFWITANLYGLTCSGVYAHKAISTEDSVIATELLTSTRSDVSLIKTNTTHISVSLKINTSNTRSDPQQSKSDVTQKPSDGIPEDLSNDNSTEDMFKNATVPNLNFTDCNNNNCSIEYPPNNMTYIDDQSNYNQSFILSENISIVYSKFDIVVNANNNLSVAGITGITLGCVTLFGFVCGMTLFFYRRKGLNKPQVLHDRCSNPDSSGYIDDASVRDNSEEMYSLDNDSFLNSLEAMTIQNYWTDTVKHTKL